MQIWNNEIINYSKFPTELKYADIDPIFKRLESFLVKNYRPVSILPVVSNVFERIMQKQMKSYVDKHLSPYLCGYRKGYDAHYENLGLTDLMKLPILDYLSDRWQRPNINTSLSTWMNY